VYNDFEERLIKLLWRSRSRPSQVIPSTTPSASASVSGHSVFPILPNAAQSPLARSSAGSDLPPVDPEKADKPEFRRNWYGRKVPVTLDSLSGHYRPAMLYAPVYNGLAAGLSLFFISNGAEILLTEWLLDGSFIRFALCATFPFLFCVSLASPFLVLNVSDLILFSVFRSANHPKRHHGNWSRCSLPPKL
jgi:hypothetical protein